MNMKTKYFFMLMIACLMGVQMVSAQQDSENRRPRKRMSMEQVAEMQASKVVKELGLDDKTAAKFTDVYKKYMKELDDVRKAEFANFAKGKERGEAMKKRQAPTDEDIDKMMRARFAQSRKVLDIREKYYDEFRKFLSPKQVQKVYDQMGDNQSRFRNEMNRRAGMPGEGGRRGSQGMPMHRN